MVIGAGMGGLCAAIRLAAAGPSCHRGRGATHPRRQDAHPAQRRRPRRCRPHGPDHCATCFDDVFCRRGRAAGRSRDPASPTPPWPATGGPTAATLDLYTDPDASAAAIAAFAGPRAEAEFRRFNRLSARLYHAFDAPMMQAARPHLARHRAEHARPTRRSGPHFCPAAPSTRHLTRSFHRPAPAPALWPLCHLCRRRARPLSRRPVPDLARPRRRASGPSRAACTTWPRPSPSWPPASGVTFRYGITAPQRSPANWPRHRRRPVRRPAR